MRWVVFHEPGIDTGRCIAVDRDSIQCATPQSHRDDWYFDFAVGNTVRKHHYPHIHTHQKVLAPDPFHVQDPINMEEES